MKLQPAVLCSFLTLAIPLAAQTVNPRAAAELRQGIAQYKSENYKQAARHFRKATQIDGQSLQAELYLARTLTQEFEPGLNTATNRAFGDEAMLHLQSLLKRQPQNAESLNAMAQLLERFKKPDEAKHYYQQAITSSPGNGEAYTGIGRMEWEMVQGKLQSLTSSSSEAECQRLRAENLPLLESSMKNLDRAFTLNDADETAATFLEMAYMTHARLDCGDAKLRAADTAQAQVWSARSMAAHQKNPEQPPPFRLEKL
jgi:tetratricopeptide (TPR) repeat protein